MKLKYHIVYLLFISTIFVQAQDNSLHLLQDVPTRVTINPAFNPNSDWYIAIPFVGTLEVDARNTGFSWQQLIDNDLSSLQSKNFAILENNWQILGGGFKIGEMYFSLDFNKRRKGYFAYPESFMDFRKGNWDYDNNVPLNYSSSGVNGMGIDYSEIALGFSKTLSEVITVGFRVKYLTGAANYRIENMDINVTTQKNGDIEVDSRTSLHTSIPDHMKFTDHNVFSSFKYNNALYTNGNHGLSIDGGIITKLDLFEKDLLIGLAINDLGFISWKNDATRYSINNSYLIDGTDITNEILKNPSSTVIDYWSALRDSIDNKFVAQEVPENYSTAIMGNFNLTAQYTYSEWLKLGAILKNYYAKDMFVPTLGLSAGTTFKKNYAITLGYTATKNSYSNIGLGLSAKIRVVHIYATTDNIVSLGMPHNAKRLTYRVGISIIPDINKTHKRYGHKVRQVKPSTQLSNKSRYKKTYSKGNTKAASEQPRISKILNTATNEENSTVTPNNKLRITGSNLKINEKDSNVGIWFINSENKSKTKVNQVINNTKNKLVIMVPPLEQGIYTIEIITQNKKKQNAKGNSHSGKFNKKLVTTIEN